MIWKKVSVGDFLIRVKDLIPIIDTDTYNLVTIKLYHRGVCRRKTVKGIEIGADKMSKVKAGQFILSGIDARNGAFGIIPNDLDGAVVTNDFWHFEIDDSIITKEYFLWLTSTPYFDDVCNKASDGTTNRVRLQAGRFFTQELMIPELEDQHKVVEELKATSDKVTLLREEYQIQLSQLTNLNQAILQEAVQGKLVAQDRSEEPASELLKRIKDEKASAGKKDKPLPPIKPEEIPFEIPESWVWCRLGDAVDSIADVDHRMPEKQHVGVPYISPRDFYGLNEIDFEGAKKISDADYNSLSRKVKPEKFDIIFPRYGTIGICRFLDYDKIFLASYSCVTIKTNKTNTDPKYIFYYCICPFSKIEIERHTVKTTQPNVGIKSILEFRFPLPPLSEQKRIVAEIEKQLGKTKQLKEHILANQQATEQLLKALLHQAFKVEELEVI